MMHLSGYCIAFISALFLALVGTPLIRAVAIRFGAIDQPDERRVHRSPTPLLGGIAIFVAAIVGIVLGGSLQPYAIGSLVGATLILLLGIWDDIYHISPFNKLIGQITSAAIVVFFGIAVEISGLPWLDALITIFWIVGITNAFNLLDNMDGLSSGVAAIAALCLFFIGEFAGQYLVATTAVALCGACLGFLRYNFGRKESRIFMGDAGSMFIGFVLALLAVRLVYETPRWLTPAIPIAVLGVPILDTSFVILNRLYKGQPVYIGGKDHISHQLVAYFSLKKRAAVIMVWLFAATLGCAAVFIVRHDFWALALTLLNAFAFCLILLLAFQHRSIKSQTTILPENQLAIHPKGQKLKKALVVLPTYNECENIASLIHQILKLNAPVDVLVVDDNSPDGTSEIVSRIASEETRVKLQKRSGKLGLGTAYAAGFRHGLEGNYDCTITMDADFSHDPKYILTMLDEARRYDVVIGSRYMNGGGVENWPWFRRFLSRGANTLTRLILRLPVHDCTSGYRCYNKKALQSITWQTIRSNGYAFLEEMLFRIHRAGLKIGETPIVFTDRRAGASKISKTEIFNAAFMLFRLALERQKDPHKIEDDQTQKNSTG